MSKNYLRNLCILWVAVLFFTASCSYRREKQEAGEDGLGSDRPTADMMARVSYADVSTIFQNRCVTCHGNSGGVNLESLAGARTALARIRQSTIVEHRMPKSPGAPLSSDERMTLWAWIDAGAPEVPANGGPVTPPPPPLTPLEPTFDSIKSHIIDKKCLSCHSPGGKAERDPFVTRSDLVDSALDIVVPGDASQSEIVHVLTPGAKKPMPPAESGITPVSLEDLEIIKTWINKGATD
jgi:uncharacterized membrane protein